MTRLPESWKALGLQRERESNHRGGGETDG